MSDSLEDPHRLVLIAGPWEKISNVNKNPLVTTDEWQRIIYRNMEKFGQARCRVMTANLRGHRGWIWEIITASKLVRHETNNRALPLDTAKIQADRMLAAYGIKMMGAKWKVMF